MPSIPHLNRPAAIAAALAWIFLMGTEAEAPALPPAGAEVKASSTAEGFMATGAVDGDRFSTNSLAAWKGRVRESNWWWEVRFPQPRRIGAVLQVVGDHPFVFRNAPRDYVWQWSPDGQAWRNLAETAQVDDRRTFRLHRLKKARLARALRLAIAGAEGDGPVLREIEVFDEPRAKVQFPEWVVVVNVTHDRALPGHGQEFIPLAKSVPGSDELEAQQILLDTFSESFLNVEPHPLCAFLSGSFKDWCEVDREPWRGTARVLRAKKLPMWASCGGAQALAILAETGVDRPWDCPHCRDPKNPRLPIYTHIGHTASKPCGDYSGCIFERGPHEVRTVVDDPAFRGLGTRFRVMESHCGQIEWAPKGWELIATAGQGTLTTTQCLRVKGRPIYAAQFHIEMAGTPEASRIIMGNFLRLARDAGGYRP